MEFQGREAMFKEWAELEPDRCRASRKGGYIAGGTYFMSFEGRTSDALLRREVQRALLDRGWKWQVDLGYPILAAVTCPTSGLCAEGAATEFPGEALLDAYLDVLKAVQSR